jgi:hypothetical protein
VKALRIPLVITAAALALAACEYRDETATRVSPPPENTAVNSQPTDTPSGAGTVQPGAPVDATPTPVQPTASVAPPDTSAMGAGLPAVQAPVAADGTAAPTELGRFLEESANKSQAADKPVREKAS